MCSTAYADQDSLVFPAVQWVTPADLGMVDGRESGAVSVESLA